MFKKLGIDIDDKKKAIIIAAAITLVTFLICSNIIKLHARKGNNIRQKVEDQSQRIALRTDIEKIEKIQQEYGKYFYDIIDQQALRSIISDLAGEADISIVSIKPLNRQRIGSVLKESLDISLSCTYNQLGIFISKIENLKNITKIESLLIKGISDFKSQAGRGEQEDKEVMESDAKVSVSIVVTGYLVKG